MSAVSIEPGAPPPDPEWAVWAMRVCWLLLATLTISVCAYAVTRQP